MVGQPYCFSDKEIACLNFVSGYVQGAFSEEKKFNDGKLPDVIADFVKTVKSVTARSNS